MKILIVDDEYKLYINFEELLKRNYPEIQIENAANAFEAYEKITTNIDIPYEVIILDQNMGGGEKNGTALLNSIHTGNIIVNNIIFVTGFYNEIPADRILTEGVPISLFIEKNDNFSNMLYKAVVLLIKEDERNRAYNTRALFGESFYELVLSEIDYLIQNDMTGYGYNSFDQQKLIGTVVRSYMRWCCGMNNTLTPDKVLNASVFFVDALCGIFDIKDELVDIIRRFMDFEEILYSIPKYRDHFFHQIKVFLLGFCIINQLNKNHLVRNTILGSKIGIKLWFITAIFHDIGYPFEKIKIWLNSYISGVLKSKHDEIDADIIPLNLEFGALFTRRYHSYHILAIVEQLLGYYKINNNTIKADLLSCLTKYVSDKPDHGIFSALILQNFLRGHILDTEIDSISVAVALHNYFVFSDVRGILTAPMSFEKDPLSFMLMYCDLAQDWGRGRLFAKNENIFGETAFDSSIVLEGPKNRCYSVNIELSYDNILSEEDRIRWNNMIFNEYINKLSLYWRVSSTPGYHLSFSVSYNYLRQGEKEPMGKIIF